MDTATNPLTKVLGMLDEHPELGASLLKIASLAAGLVIALGATDDKSGRKVKKAARQFSRNARKTAKSATRLFRGLSKLARQHPQRVTALLASVAALGAPQAQKPDEATKH
jgi:hypothetical protein